MDDLSFLGNVEIDSMDELFRQYKENPEEIDGSWQKFFQGFEFAKKDYSATDLKSETFDKEDQITTLCCWAHARRKFFEAKDYDIKNAELILQEIQSLYKVEERCRDLEFEVEQIKQYRQEHSIPILNNLHKLLKDISSKTLPSSPLGKAIVYTLNRWTKLLVYAENGILQIDNNLVENSIRPVALGRKNYMFAGSHERAQDAAMLYSLFATCRLHNINPEKWLTFFFDNINSTPKDCLHQLLPQNYTTEKE